MENAKFRTIEGARGLLALWVFADHILWAIGMKPQGAAPLLQVLFAGRYAVDVFILISGFVITHLLEIRHEHYGTYIFRRFMRLWPLHIVLTLIGLFLFLQHFGDPRAAYEGPAMFARSPKAYEHWPWLLLGNVTMLHGLIPNSFIPLGPLVLNGPSWSISLEWQFYLIAPLLLRLLKIRNGIPILLGTLLIVLLRPAVPLISHGAFLPDHIEFFVIGSLSRLHFKDIGTCLNNISRPLRWALFLLPLLCFSDLSYLWSAPEKFTLNAWIPLWIWLYLLLLASRENSANLHTAGRILLHPGIQYLGKISYSLYLTHHLILLVFLQYFGAWLKQFPPLTAFLLLTGILGPVTLLLSALTYRLIERPGMQFSKNRTGVRPIAHAR